MKHDETKLDTRLKTKESNALQSDVDAFIARGGKITQVETGATAKATYRY